MQIDLNALANFVEDTLDCSEDFEEDEFAFTFQGERIYCQRHRSFFRLVVAQSTLELPR